MSAYKISGNLFLCAIVFMAMPLIASARPKTEGAQMEKKTIQLGDQATVDGKALAPGKYEVVIEGNKVRFEQDGRTVVTAPCDWKTLEFKPKFDSTTLSAHNVLQELQFEGSNQALEVR